MSALRDAMALTDRFGPRPHPLDRINPCRRELLSEAQLEELATIRASSKNWLDSDLVADDTLNRVHLWRAAVIVDRHGAALILPRDGQERLLEYLAHTWQADECRWMPLAGNDAAWDELARVNPAVPPIRGTRQLLRLWWD